MWTRGGKSEDHIPCVDIFPGQQQFSLSRANRKSGNVIVGTVIHSWHLCRFASNQCAASESTAICDTGNHVSSNGHVQSSSCVIVQKKQRLGTLYHQVID